MKNENKFPANPVELRRQAEAKRNERMQKTGPLPATEMDIRQTLHELQVHQIELEIQNEELRRIQLELEEARARYFDLYDLAPVGYLTLIEKGLILEANLTAAILLGVKRSGLPRQPFSQFIAKEDQDIYYQHRKQLIQTNEPQTCELRMLKPDGTTFWAHLESAAGQASNSKPICRVVLSDISARKQAEDALRQSQEKWHRLFEILPVGVSIVDTKNLVLDTNPALAQILELSQEALLEGAYKNRKFIRPDMTLMPPEEFPSLRAIKEQKTIRNVEIGMEKEDGTIIWTSVSATPLSSGTGSATVTVDITARKCAEDGLRHTKDLLEVAHQGLQQALATEQILARIDSLTGLYNRRYFFEFAIPIHEFSATLQYPHQLTIIMFDADNFKQINDTVGHAIGDKVLKQIAQTAAAQIRAVDVLARYGGDEFILLLPQTSAQEALPVAERIRQSVQIDKSLYNNITLSIGIADMRRMPPDESIEHVIQRADRALYAAKNAGRNRIIIYNERTAGDEP